MNVPLLDLRIQYAAIRDEVDAAIRRVVESQYFILGPEVKAFEEEIAAFCGARHAIGVSSGTDALLVALMALDIEPGDEIVTTPFTFFATAGVIARLRARPVFVDIEPVSFNMDPDQVAAAIGPRTRAIMPVHLYGRCVDPRIQQIADEAGIPVVEDAAQAIGATDADGRIAGSIGLCGCFSFFPTKNLGGFGDAGLVTTSDDAFAERVVRLRVHGGERRYFHREVGGNFRIDALQAAVLRVKLAYLPEWNAARRKNADRYRALFAETGLESVIDAPADVEGHIYHQFVVRARDRNGLRDHLIAAGIGNEVYYPLPLHRQECFADLGYGEGAFPVAEAAAGEVLALPIYPELTEADLRAVVGAIASYYGKRQPT